MAVYGFCRFVSITGSVVSPSVLVVVVVVVCQFSFGLLPVLVNGFAVRSFGFGSSPFFVNFSSALGIGVSLTYFVNFGAAGDYYFPIYIKKYIPIRDNGKWWWRENVGNGEVSFDKAIDKGGRIWYNQSASEEFGEFRRANDLSKNRLIAPSLKVAEHTSRRWGLLY